MPSLYFLAKIYLGLSSYHSILLLLKLRLDNSIVAMCFGHTIDKLNKLDVYIYVCINSKYLIGKDSVFGVNGYLHKGEASMEEVVPKHCLHKEVASMEEAVLKHRLHKEGANMMVILN